MRNHLLSLAVAVLMSALSFGCDNEGERSPADTPSAASASATPAAAATPEAALLIGADTALPADLALFVETGCWQCDGPATGLVRLYTDASGAVRQDQLAIQLPGTYWMARASADGATLAVVMCDGVCRACTECFPERQVVYLSHDGGRTFEELGAITDRLAGVVAVLANSVVVAERMTYTTLPGGEAVVPPSAASSGRLPFPLSPTEIGWLSANGNSALRTDGGVAFTLPDDREIWHVAPIDDGATPAYVVHSSSRIADRHFVSVVAPAGVVRERELGGVSLFALDAVRGGPDALAPLIVANAFVDGPTVSTLFTLPSIVDLVAGEILRMSEAFSPAQLEGERNTIVMAVRGPFLRVVTPGDCLHVREAPATESTSEACVPDAALLVDAGGTSEAEGRTWHLARTFAGIEGWVSSEFIER